MGSGGGSHPPRAGSCDHQTGSGSAGAIWIVAGTILAQGGAIPARGLMSLIQSSWGGPGG